MNDPKIWHEPLERAQRLHQLGFAEEELLRAVNRGQAAAADCTNHNPALQKSINAWGETIRSLRDDKVPQGWKSHDEQHQQPLVLHPNGNIAVTAAAGDEYTGDKNRIPATKSSKGTLTRSAVKVNSLKYGLFGDIRKPNTRETWMLLFYRDKNSLEIRSELSLPVDINEEGQVDSWHERIILSSIPFSGTSLRISDNQPETPEIDIDIKRRA